MNWFVSFIVAFALAWVGAQNAHAVTVPASAGKMAWGVAVKGKQTQVATGSELDALVKAQPYSNSQGASELSTLLARKPAASTGGHIAVGADGTVPVGGKGVPVSAVGSVAKDALIGGVVGAVTGGVAGAVIGAGIPLTMAYLNDAGVRINPDTQVPEIADEAACTMGPCYWYKFQDKRYRTLEDACLAYASYMNTTGTDIYVAHAGDPATVTCYVLRKTSGGSVLLDGNYGVGVVVDGQREPDSPTWYPATPQQVKDALYKKTPDPGIVDELAEKRGTKWPVDDVTVTGPTSIDGEKSVKNNPDGSKTETTTKTDYKYEGSKVTEGKKTITTTTTKPDGSKEVTTEEQTPSEQEPAPRPDRPKEDPPTDTPLPPVPDLYVRKYPQGMEGIYNDYKDRLKNTQFMELAKKLMPQVSDGGTCPRWPLDLSLASWADYGTHDVAPPCWIWDVAAAILVVSALLLARALVFGG